MKKTMSVLLAAAMCSAMLAGCGSTAADTAADASAETTAAAATEAADSSASAEGVNVFKIGGTSPLTGAAAIYGNAVKNGAQIAVDEINAEGGDIQFELNYQDDEGDAEKAQAALKTVTKRLDMAAAKHVIHKNQASNRKSGLAKLVNSINA